MVLGGPTTKLHYTLLAWRPTSCGEDSPLRHPNLFYVSLLNADGGTTPTREGHKEFFWHGTKAARGGALVAWSTVRRPVTHDSLGVRHLEHTNTALLSKWVIWVMKPSSDMVSMLLHEAYGHSFDWSVWATPRRRDCPVVAGLQGIFPLVRSFFRPQLGDGAHFCFWEDDWSGMGRLGDAFPRLYALAPDPATTIWTMWTGA